MVGAKFRNLVSFRRNYMSPDKTENDLREAFKSVFLNGDESNKVFFNSCDIKDLHDLCACFELYFSMFPNADLRDLGIAKYKTETEEYFMFTISEAIRDVRTGEICSTNEEITALFQIRQIAEKDRRVKGFFDSFVTNRLTRKEDGNHPGKVADQMLRKMISNEANTSSKNPIMVCKSNLRVMVMNYGIVSDLFTRAKEAGNIEESQVREFLQKLEDHKKDLQERLQNLTEDIENKYESNYQEIVPYAVKISDLEGEAQRILNSETRDDANARARARRQQIERVK